MFVKQNSIYHFCVKLSSYRKNVTNNRGTKGAQKILSL